MRGGGRINDVHSESDKAKICKQIIMNLENDFATLDHFEANNGVQILLEIGSN